ncbi:MAG: cupin domain-containing protein [Thaumarchaeota archaeon]|nr:cupin domain-containing protein [Nitrososphaerota archaeon]
MEIEKWDNSWGELTESKMRERLTKEGYTVLRYTYQPGTVFADHSHPVDKKDTVLTGTFRMRAFGKEFMLEAGDMLLVRANTIHSAEVVGDQPVVSLDATRLV